MKSHNDQSCNRGGIYRLAEELRSQERAIIDFSAPTNPLGVSKKVKAELRRHLKYLHNYPDPDTNRLRKRLAQHHGIDPETILCGNGSTELVYLLARALSPRKLLVPLPTFSEFERACKMMCPELQVITYTLRETDFELDPSEFICTMSGNLNTTPSTQHSTPFFDMVFLCNPHNPTGRLIGRDAVVRIADAAKRLECYLVVDEAFIDFCPDNSMIKDVEENPYLVVLRSMSPFYALPGLRIGYGVFPLLLAENLKKYKEPWTINSLAQRAAVAALKDKAYRKETFNLIECEKKYLEKNFRKLGIEFIPSSANFYLVRMENAEKICLQLRGKGILLCDRFNFKGRNGTHVRIAVKSHKENALLIKELAGILDRRE